jgi:dTMP kinase
MVVERVGYYRITEGLRYMQAGHGVFIAIEGTDGSGKGTQFERLAKRLAGEGHNVATFDFPQYDHPSSFFVREYLNGRYGSAEQVGPYTGSLFYALDRFQAAPAIRQALAEGKIVLANRFVGSNMAHQGTKFHHAEERRGYFIWLDNLEFEMLRIPRPTMSFVLRVPAGIAQKLVDQKDARNYTEKKRDLHEADLQHLEKSVEVYDDMCRLFPKDFVRVECTDADRLMTIDEISDRLWSHLQPMLPVSAGKKTGSITPGTAAVQPDTILAKKESDVEPAAAKAAKPAEKQTVTTEPPYTVPQTLSADVRKQYVAAMNELGGAYEKMLQRLIRHLTEASGMSAAERTKAVRAAIRATAEHTLQAVLPVASRGYGGLLPAFSPSHNAAINGIIRDQLSQTYAEARESVSLTDVWPRNELDIVPDMAYQYADLPIDTIRDAAATWKYNQKVDIFEAYVAESDLAALHGIRYSWDIVSDIAALAALKNEAVVTDVVMQYLTPRYGYEVPQLIEEAGLTEQFEACFDRSLELNSLLQQKGFIHEAQYAVLLGHRLRWRCVTTAAGHYQMHKAGLSSPAGLTLTASAMRDTIALIHPITVEVIDAANLTTT